MPSIAIPEGYQYVLAAATSTVWLNIFQFVKVGSARKAAGVKYPQMYAENSAVVESPPNAAFKFNCTQRAHQNTLESLPFVLLGLLVGGLKYPQVAAGLGAAWVVGRISYTINYSSGYPAKRNKGLGFIGSIGLLGLSLVSTYSVYSLIVESL